MDTPKSYTGFRAALPFRVVCKPCWLYLASRHRFRELKEYIEKRRDELAPRDTSQLSQEELLGETTSSKSKKGFA